jgi:hypothetical protein
MKILGYILVCFLLAGCAATVDQTQPESAQTATPPAAPLAGAAPAPATVYDFLNPLTPAEVETVKKRLDYLQPYMTQDECWKILDLPKRQYPTSVSGERPAFTIAMTLREDSILGIVFDRRGYVVLAKLGDKKWEWKQKSPNTALEPTPTAP